MMSPAEEENENPSIPTFVFRLGLMFFKISSMIHIFNKNNEPFYFEKQFSSSIESNTINEAIKSDQRYDIKNIIQSIQQNNKPKTS
jgi:hypothetical protein